MCVTEQTGSAADALAKPRPDLANVVKQLGVLSPTANDGAQVYDLIRRCPPLDVNSCYAYLLICDHFGRTSALVRTQDRVLGFISAYIPPQCSDTLFVWQVAVADEARGAGLAGRMLSAILERPECSGVQFVETTVSPSNTASDALFGGFAKRHHAPLQKQEYFTPDQFGQESHEEEILYRIGPLGKNQEKE